MKMETGRLILRQWKSEDYQPYAESYVLTTCDEIFLALISHEESNEQANKIQSPFWEKDWGF